jgi:hypothetical protein
MKNTINTMTEQKSKYNDMNFDERINIYNETNHLDIDQLNNKIHSGRGTVENLARFLAELFPKSKKEEDNTDNDQVLLQGS